MKATSTKAKRPSAMTRRELRSALERIMGSTEPADLALRAELTEELGARLRDAALADRERTSKSTKAAPGLASRFPLGARTGDPKTCPLCLQAPAERAACWHGRTR